MAIVATAGQPLAWAKMLLRHCHRHHYHQGHLARLPLAVIQAWRAATPTTVRSRYREVKMPNGRQL